MNLHKTRIRIFLVVAVCLTCHITPTTGFAQPGRTFTPPTQNIQANMQQQFRDSIQRDNLNTRLDANRVLKASQPSIGAGGGGALAKNAVEAVDVVVTTVEPNTQCERLGLKKGDVLVSYLGKELKSTQQVQNLVKLHANDAVAIELVVSRNNEILHLNVDPGRLGVRMRVEKQAPR
jgi:S1-C subfamily serine protease